jgi:hypothetical protein
MAAEQIQLVGQTDIGQTRGPEDLMEYTRPVCPGHYNHMVVSGNLIIGSWQPRRQWTDGTEEIILVWVGNSFEIVHESSCMYCNDSDGRKGYCLRDMVPSLSYVDITLKSR